MVGLSAISREPAINEKTASAYAVWDLFMQFRTMRSPSRGPAQPRNFTFLFSKRVVATKKFSISCRQRTGRSLGVLNEAKRGILTGMKIKRSFRSRRLEPL